MDEKDSAYYDNERIELLEMLPKYLTKILDIGCGSGRLGQNLKIRHQCEVTGIELNQNAALIAAQRLDQVYQGFVEQNIHHLKERYFDCIILADVLEHLRNPDKILQKLLTKLAKGGLILISVPNFCYYEVIAKIIYGNFAYEHDGILDNTHISFFSRNNFYAFLKKHGLQILEQRTVHTDIEPEQELINILNEFVDISDFWEEAKAFQYFFLLTLEKSHKTDFISELIDNLKHKDQSALNKQFLLLKDYLRIWKKDINALYCYAYLALLIQQYEVAINSLQHLIQLEGSNRDNCLLLSIALLKVGQKKLSEIFAEKSDKSAKLSVFNRVVTNFPLE